MIEGAIPRGTVCLFSGGGSTGKSYLDLQLQVACATYQRWLGIHVRRCKTFALYGEDPEDIIHRRVQSICDRYNVATTDLEDMEFIARRPGLDDFTMFECDKYQTAMRFTPFFEQVQNYVLDNGIEILMLDTVSRVYLANRNLESHVVAFMAGLEHLAMLMDGAIILNVHPSKTQESTYSGNAQWEALVRAHLHIKRPAYIGKDGKKHAYDPEDPNADHDARVLMNLKSNWGPLGRPIKLRWSGGVFRREDEPAEARDYTQAAADD